MKDFSHVKFNGEFRTYQKRVLDNSEKYLDDGKINIVAPPVSGKTTLGLELIIRLGKPCLILSPTTTVRDQWGSRFACDFLERGEDVNDYFSCDLRAPKLINSVTYQAVYSAVTGVETESEGENINYTDIDLSDILKSNNIKTVCLDEAHHLQNKWQSALERFLSGLDDDIKVISLTATPPYDAGKSEWERYIRTCGEIDEEISVPELVKEKSLCPHQDFIYFNYPAKNETASFNDYRKRVLTAIDEIAQTDIIDKAYEFVLKNKADYEFLFKNSKEINSVLVFASYKGIKIDKKLIRVMTASKSLPRFNTEFAQNALSFLMENESILPSEQREKLDSILKSRDLSEKGRICLTLTDELKKTLASSAGKLNSIGQIARFESSLLGASLRMLILTDYIRKETLSLIGSDAPLTKISIVSVFETVRRMNINARIGAVSGSLIILPSDIATEECVCASDPIGNTGYSVYDFNSSNSDKVAIISKLFERGDITVLIGTKSLLGEGWDSPCVNSLVLASFVGSFMLSNQMRGRAIRTDIRDPNKVSNIWHLVTLEPEYIFTEGKISQLSEKLLSGNDIIYSSDYETVKRRFGCFVGPNYDTGNIENGIERVTVIKPPFNSSGIELINKRMLAAAADKAGTADKWQRSAENYIALVSSVYVPDDIKVKPFNFYNALLASALAFASVCIVGNYQSISRLILALSSNVFILLLLMAASCALMYFLTMFIFRIIINASPARFIKNISEALLKTLKEINVISHQATLRVDSDKSNLSIGISLMNANEHDRNLFNTAVREMFSPIENQRYIFVSHELYGLNYKYSYACPSLIDDNKKYTDIFVQELGKTVGRFDALYTRSERGRKVILHCRRKSYITKNSKKAGEKKKLLKTE